MSRVLDVGLTEKQLVSLVEHFSPPSLSDQYNCPLCEAPFTVHPPVVSAPLTSVSNSDGSITFRPPRLYLKAACQPMCAAASLRQSARRNGIAIDPS